MKTILRLIVITATMAMFSCAAEQKQASTSGIPDNAASKPIVIDVDNPTLDQPPAITDLIDTVFLIPFKGDGLIMTDNPRAYKYGDRIFVTENDVDEPLKVFDGNGNLIRAIRKGNGPGEVNGHFFNNIFYDKEKETLYISNKKEWSKFDRNGNFLGKEKIPFDYMGMCRVKDEYVFCSSSFWTDPSINNHIFVTDGDFNVTHKYIPSTGKRPYGGSLPNTPLGTADGHAYIMRDTIYWYQNSKLTPQYYYKYYDRFDPYDPASANTSGGPCGLKGFAQDYYFENSQTTAHAIEYFCKSHKYIFRDKKSGNFFVCAREYGRSSDWKPLPWYCIIWTITDDGYFVSHINDYYYNDFKNGIKDFLSPEDKKILNSYKPDDNPILVLFKFKSF